MVASAPAVVAPARIDYDAGVQYEEQLMKFLDRWRFGAAAVKLHSAVRDALRDIDSLALLEALAEVLRIERKTPDEGQGEWKWGELVKWFKLAWPQYADRIDTLAIVVRALVEFWNVIGVFRKRGA